MQTLTRSRQPKGTPSGGEFASEIRAEADFNLTVDAIDAIDEPEISRRRTGTSLTPEQILSEALRLAQIAAIRTGLSREDIEDVAQGAIASALLSVKRSDGKSVEAPLLYKATRALASRLVDTHSRHEDSKAYRDWKVAVSTKEAELGRHLSPTERNTIAEQIRENWHNPRHKPSRGFQYETKVISTDAYGVDLAETYAAPDTVIGAGSVVAHDLADRLEDRTISKAEAKRHLWNALAEDDEDLPKAHRGFVSKTAHERHRKNIRDAGAVAVRYLSGQSTHAEEASLFAPFGAPGNVTPIERDAIATALATRQKYAHQIWRGALDFATESTTS